MPPVLRRLFKDHVRPYFRRLLLAMLFMALSAGATAWMARSLQPVIDNVFMNKDATALVPMALLILVIFLVKGVAGFGEMTLLNSVGQRVVTDVQARLFHYLLRADYALYHEFASGEMLSRITHDVAQLRTTVSQAITNMGKDTLTLAGLIAVMFYQDARLALITFVIFPLSVFPILWIGRRVRGYARRTQEGMGAWTVFLEEVLQGTRLIRAYTMEAYALSRSQVLMEHLVRLNLKGVRVRALSHPMLETLGGLAVVAVILFEGYHVIHGQQTAGTFVSFVAAVLLSYEPLKRLAHLNAHLQEGAAAAQRIFDLLDRPITLQDGSRPLTITDGSVRFEGVDFSYPSRPNVQALSNLTFEVRRGEKIGIVGPSGAGKSTLVNLLLRFFDPSHGTISIDGQALNTVTLASLRNTVAWVGQETVLFDDTIAANIAQGRPGASQHAIEDAARQAGAHDFISALPLGYNTPVGQQGLQLSGGQRQRLSVARAILKDAPILLLDEATSSLDPQAEHAVHEALNRLSEGRTTLMITHRLDRLVDADRIIVLSEGSIVQSGTYQELQGQAGLFRTLLSQIPHG